MDTMTNTSAPSAAATTAAPPPTGVRPDEVDALPDTPDRGRLGRLLRGAPGDPTWARPALLGLLLGTAILYLYNLTSSGYANSFYSAAVQAGSGAGRRSSTGPPTPPARSPSTSRRPRCG